MHLLLRQGTPSAQQPLSLRERLFWLGQRMLRCFAALLRAACLL
jgi:hypothetical protein